MERVVPVFLILLTFFTWTAGEKVSCVLSENCTLPCHFDDSLIEVMWFKDRDLIPITYYPESLGLSKRYDYRDRVFLFQDQIPKGNASLLLKVVKINDQGTYRCRGNKTEKLIQLIVYTLISSRDVVLEQVGDELVCRSEGIYPQPNVTWSPSDGTETNTTAIVSEKGLYSISSFVRLSGNPAQEEHSCNINTPYSSGRATVTPQHRDPSPDKNLFFLCLLFLLVPLVPLVWCCCIKLKSQGNTGNSENRNGDVEVPLNNNNKPQQNIFQNGASVQHNGHEETEL